MNVQFLENLKQKRYRIMPLDDKVFEQLKKQLRRTIEVIEIVE